MLADTTYNWDDIQVGRFDLNHSENFFTEKHHKHEKLSEDFSLLRIMASTNASFSSNIAIEGTENKENTKPEPTVQTKKENSIDNPSSPLKAEVKVQSSEQVQVKTKSPPSPSPSDKNRRPANLLTKFKTSQLKLNCTTTSTGAVGKNGKRAVPKGEPPSAYEFKDIYKRKKEEMIKKLMEEEKNNRVFHSRPVPKSVLMPVFRKIRDHYLTVPHTPLVLRTSIEAEERRRKRFEEYRKQNVPPKFISREAHVLHEEPFKPKKLGQVVQPIPFKLNVEKRLGERKQYDEHIRITSEMRKKQEEEERKKHEEELIKDIRKLTSFKARPNPFK